MIAHYVGWAAWIAILGMSSWQIDNAGHFGGLVPGVLVGYFVRRRGDSGVRARRAWVYAAWVLTGITVATILLAAGHPIALGE
jgi:membrane associated rhomboid family serine protease